MTERRRVLGDGASWEPLPEGSGGGASPGGSGTELQYRFDATTFGGITGSSVSGSTATFGGVNATVSNIPAAWDSGTAYVAGNVVTYGGSAWQAIGSSTNSAPSENNTDWRLVVAGIYSPAQISGLALWLDASDATTINAGSPSDNDAVSTWADKSGNSYNATQATSLFRPVYKTNIQNSLAVVRFDGTSDAQFLNVLAAGALAMLNAQSGVTVAAVARGTNSGSQIFAALTVNTVRRVGLNIASDSGLSTGFGASRDDAVDFSDALLDDSATLTAQTFNAATMFTAVGAASVSNSMVVTDIPGVLLVKTGLDVSPGQFPAVNLASIEIGGSNAGPGTANLTGDICELIVFTRALNSRERRQLLEYLSAKWDTL